MDAAPTADAASRATTARTLTVAGGACLLLGAMVGSPAGAILLLALGALFALPALLLAKGGMRTAALAVLVISLGLAVAIYPDFRKHMDDYSARARP